MYYYIWASLGILIFILTWNMDNKRYNSVSHLRAKANKYKKTFNNNNTKFKGKGI